MSLPSNACRILMFVDDVYEDLELLINAGAHWQDAAVVVDRHFVSSRRPDDLPEFCRAILRVLAG